MAAAVVVSTLMVAVIVVTMFAFTEVDRIVLFFQDIFDTRQFIFAFVILFPVFRFLFVQMVKVEPIPVVIQDTVVAVMTVTVMIPMAAVVMVTMSGVVALARVGRIVMVCIVAVPVVAIVDRIIIGFVIIALARIRRIVFILIVAVPVVAVILFLCRGVVTGIIVTRFFGFRIDG